MADPKTFQIRIESILGGQSLLTHFATPDQFMASLGIDPGLSVDDGFNNNSPYPLASGLLRPGGVISVSSSTLNNRPLWIVTESKGLNKFYVYDSAGSAYAYNNNGAFAGLSDGGSLSNSSGNGAAYNDNYVYFSKNTTVARYGPLNGTPAFDGDYWSTTLGLTPLSNTTYPTSSYAGGITYPNHVMHRHSDGKLYIADVVGNQGAIHFIATTKTTVEGDTNNGSTYNKLSFGHGLWPIALESYGSNLVIALTEITKTTGVGASGSAKRAKLAFWDTTSQNFNSIVWVEFPDAIISAMKNVNGILYVVSSNGIGGFRLSKFVGGYTFEEVFYSDTGGEPFAGAIDGTANRLVFGSYTSIPESGGGSVYSYGLQKSGLGQGVFNIMNSTSTSTATHGVTALAFGLNTGLALNTPILGWGNGSSGGTNNSIDVQSQNGFVTATWWSQMYKIGQPFKIKKIRILLATPLSASMLVTPSFYLDEGDTKTTLTAINSTNYPAGSKNIVIRPNGLTGNHSFWFELRWTGSVLCTVGLPITIEYELIDD